MAEEIQTLQGPEDFAEETIVSPALPDRRLIGLGCGGAAVVVVAVALVALFLPPFNLAAQMRGCQALDESNPVALGQDGISAAWIGPDNVRVCLGSIPLDEFAAGQSGGDLKGAAAAVPPYLQIVSPLYTAEMIGDGQTQLEIVLPADAQPTEMVDLYSWDSQTQQWAFIPGQVDATTGTIRTEVVPRNVAVFLSKPITPLIGTTLESNHVLDSTTASTLNIILPTGLSLGADGTLSGSLIGGWGLGKGYAVIPAVRAADANGLSMVLNNDASLALHVDDIKTFIVGDGYDGIAIDYSNVNPADRDRFTRFIADLTSAVHEYNKMVVVVLPMPVATEPGLWDGAAYDWRGIGASADAVVINMGDNPADYTIGGNVTSLLGWAVGQVSRVKIYLALSASSARDTGGVVTSISYDEALAPLGTIQTTTALAEGRNAYDPGSQLSFSLNGNIADFTADQNTGTYSYSLSDDKGQHKIWVVTAATVRARLDMINKFGVGGMLVDGLAMSGNDGGLLTALNEFKVNSTSTVPSQLVMTWTVTGASGALLNQTTGIGTPLAWQPSEAGDYTVQGQIAGGRVSDRGSVSVHVAPPPTTPPPTKAPVKVTADPNKPKPTAAATTPPPPPVGGSVLAGFNLGGQTHGLGHPDQMHYAGMTWVKFQHKWSPGDDPSVVAGKIQQGHGAGFKVLLSIPGASAASIDFGAYTNFVKGVAGLGADAIEVWNEENFDREWPANDISGGSYVTKMLAPAFNAIKSANPNTIVISGAPTPSGAFGGCGVAGTGQAGCDDWFYIKQMAEAGASSYADCIGVHFNAGATPPSASTGHPADGGDHHYSWYYSGMLNLYAGTFGKPLCFTELGYVSPEGYGQLPSWFAWGNGTTAAQQAQWLSETAVLASQSGKVHMIIVFNVDFTVWEPTDPQAGYAMIRPGGSCPACDALNAVMP
jgi:hypothetical protein